MSPLEFSLMTSLTVWITGSVWLGFRNVKVIEGLRERLKEVQDDLRREREERGGNMLPAVFMDAEAIVVVIDRVPNREDHYDPGDVPTAWLHPRLQRSWKITYEPNGDDHYWRETTLEDQPEGPLRFSAITKGDVFVSASAVHDEGLSRTVDAVTRVDDGNPVSQQVGERIAAMNPFVIARLDEASGGNNWRRMADAFRPGGMERLVRSDPNEPRRRRNVRELDGDRPRPIRLDDKQDDA